MASSAPAVIPGVEPIPLGVLHIGIVVLQRENKHLLKRVRRLRVVYLPGKPVEVAVELLNSTLGHTCGECLHGRNKTKDYHGSD